MIIKNLPPKKYIEMFSDSFEIIQSDNYFFAVISNNFDDFRLFSYVNGLNVSKGGSHIDYITNEVVNRLRSNLQKKYKEIKPGDIKNKIMVVAVLKEFPNLKFDSQTKEAVTNGITEIKSYFGEVDFDGLTKKILKNESIINPITEVYKIKEEYAKRKELSGLDKKVKKIKSDKYLPAIKNKKYLLITEGASATGGLAPVLGREECGYFELKGKPLNAWSQPQSKFTNNKELSELYKIIQNENYNYIVVASDQDLDGIHIRGLLTGFIQRYLPDFNDRFYLLQTPIIVLKRNNKISKWFYDIEEYSKSDIKGYESKYYKGLGSWVEKDLKYIVSADTFEGMLLKVKFDNLENIEEWLGDDPTPRKKYIEQNTFSIAML